ncbi:phosphate ABC transporter permease PstA [Lacimicrobium alkaliphilum]|uniref:Phosphate transport system permease protein PstA n=1 Tax=Lacimicrobium alkaliphilum TaxID=1526571 RepID=A0A0U2PIR5_9ALTE|nr:phosphate ABC transporter permease PstA [Lacimicrobium alkaliphilum]ALS99389.1 phosphate ABC transporter permease [Lacimicrobium alkaliphilum]
MSDWKWFRAQKEGLPVVSSAALVAVILLLLGGMIGLMLFKGAQHFWPPQLYQVTFKAQQDSIQLRTIYATLLADDFVTTGSEMRWLFNEARLDQFSDQQYLLPQQHIVELSTPESLMDIQLTNGNRLFARLQAVVYDQQLIDFEQTEARWQQVRAQQQQIRELTVNALAPVHQQLAELDRRGVEDDAPARLRLLQAYEDINQQITTLQQETDRYRVRVSFADNSEYSLALADIEEYRLLNQLSALQKVSAALDAMWQFVSEKPKRANNVGGVFPALFGTVVMVLMMTVIVTPLGVLAAIYLNEYAPANMLTSFIRIGVNNLAGVPSIVYGVFGLGFFVYQVGGNIDKLFFSEQLPAPTFGAPGIFWAALTMAMLTLPVVIVATEEGLRRVPNSLRQGSFALGATKFETIWRTVIPMASPGIMTGVILAIARGAGEVAPLLLVGAVKFAPSLPVDGEFPYLHLERQFMHLGVLIYDGAFHSNNIGHGSSMMFASCLLLLLVVLTLNTIAVMVRARLRRQYLAMSR